MGDIAYPKIVTDFGQIFLLRQYFVNLSFYFRAKLGGSAAVGQLSLFEQKHLLGDKLNIGHYVSSYDNDFIKGGFRYKIAQAYAFLGVKSRGGLIEDNDFRIAEKCLG